MLIFKVISSTKVALVAHEVGPLIDHKVASHQPDRAAPVEEHVKVGEVDFLRAALVAPIIICL